MSLARALGVAAFANPEAAAMAGTAVLTGGAGAGIGAMAASSAGHWRDRVGGHGVAPFFGEPLTLVPNAMATNGGGAYSSWQVRFQEDCDDLAESDEAQCRKIRNPATQARCFASASERYAQCITKGPSRVTTELYTSKVEKRK